MWIEAGFEPDTFWQQSPETFQLTMDGVRKRLEAGFERELSIAHATACFTGATQSKGGLKPLQHYLKRPGGKQRPTEMLAALKALGSRSNMKIRRLPQGGE